MVNPRMKRGPASSPKKKVKKQRVYIEVPELTEISFSPLEDMVIDIQFRREVVPNLKMADVFGFIRFSSSLPELNIELVNTYLKNYNINDGSSIVNGRRIVLTETLLNKALYLPISEIGVGDSRPPPNFEPGSYFKTGMDALDVKQGWKLAEVDNPAMMEWLRFVQRRMVLGAHGTYLAQKYLYAATQTFNGMQFNWALFVVERIYQELDYKRKKGKIGTLLSASYISAAVQYQLSQAPTESDQELERERATVEELTRPQTEARTEGRQATEVACGPSERPRQEAASISKDKAVVPEASSSLQKKKQPDDQRTQSNPSEARVGVATGSNPSAEEVAERMPAATSPVEKVSKFRDFVVQKLEHMTELVRKYQEPDYAKMAADLKVLRVGGRKLQAEFDKVCSDMGALQVQMAELQKERQELLREKEDYAEKIRRERERNSIAYVTWMEQRNAIEAKLKNAQMEHQRIKDDLDLQLSVALRENVALQDSVREKEYKVEKLEWELAREKSTVDVGVQVMTLGSEELANDALRRQIELMQQQLQSVGRYNEELLAKYEPRSGSSDEEDEASSVDGDGDDLEAGTDPPGLPIEDQPLKDSEEWLDAVAATPVPTESTPGPAPPAGSVELESAVVVPGEESVFEVLPRNCEDAI